MHLIRARNPHQALHAGLRLIAEQGIPTGSRYGDVLTLPGPAVVEYTHPNERVIFWPERDANPFLHAMESIWMLAGRNDVKYLAQFANKMTEFSDDGIILNGAYGYRWRKHFGEDQLDQIVKLITDQPFTRRAVLQMWDYSSDFHTDESKSKDVPCNTQIMFRVSYGKKDEANRLNMSVINRSNDLIWGLAGSNCVHFSALLEYMAARLRLVVGTMTTFTNNLHVYLDVYEKVRHGDLANPIETPDPYSLGETKPFPMVTIPETWDRDLALFMEDPATVGCLDPFFNRIAKPAHWAHAAAKKKKFTWALEILDQMPECDWKRAMIEWTLRRKAAWRAKNGAVVGETV